MLLILSIVCDFLLCSPSFEHEDSDSEHESFQKIRGEKFERPQALSHEAKILKIHENVDLVTSGTRKMRWGLALRAMFKNDMAGRDCSAESKQYCCSAGGKFVKIKAGNYL